MKLKKGDLVYIPTSTTLSKYKNNDSSEVEKYKNTEKPLNLLVVETSVNKQLGVHYLGEIWFLSERNAYLVKEGN